MSHDKALYKSTELLQFLQCPLLQFQPFLTDTVYQYSPGNSRHESIRLIRLKIKVQLGLFT